ncbi:MAG: PIN domain-containing protein [Terriglobales bacterium]|jgi:predicted nucleic acid-binding protein
MKFFFDTSVLVAASVESHEHHERSLAVFSNADRSTACCAAHTLAELYSTLTRLPGKVRLRADEALLVLESVEQHLDIVWLDAREYRRAIRSAAAGGIVGGTIYDALLGWCALKAGATRILTWDTSDFRRLGDVIAVKVENP